MERHDRVGDAHAVIERAYADALKAVVTPGARVLDLSGAFGRNTVLAVRAGAGLVHAVQSDTTRDTAKLIAAANGCATRVRWVHDLAEVHDDVDVIVAPISADRPLHGASILAFPAVAAALGRGAIPIPASEALSLAVVEAPALHHRHAGVWDVARALDMTAARHASVNQWSSHRLSPSQLCVPPQRCATMDYRSGLRSVAGTAEWTVQANGLAHGLAIWPEITFATGVTLDAGPATDRAFRQTFFPWPEPVQLCAGDRIDVMVRGDGLGAGNVWTWTSSIRREATELAAFRQSTFFADPRRMRHE